MTQPYFAIMMPWGRVGSNLVVSVLVEHCRIGIINEPTTVLRSRRKGNALEGFAIDRDQIDYLRRFPNVEEYAIQPGPLPRRGIKLSHRSLTSPMAAYEAMATRGFRIVAMDRANHIKCAISQIRAEQRHVAGEKGGWSVKRGEARPPASAIEPRVALTRARSFAAASAQLQGYLGHFFPGAHLAVEYESLNSDPQTTIRGIADYLGLSLPRRFELPHVKATDDNLSASVSNWDEVRTAFAASEFAPLLEG